MINLPTRTWKRTLWLKCVKPLLRTLALMSLLAPFALGLPATASGDPATDATWDLEARELVRLAEQRESDELSDRLAGETREALVRGLMHQARFGEPHLLALYGRLLGTFDVHGPGGLTPLSAAAEYGRHDLVAALLDAGADPKFSNEVGEGRPSSPLDVATAAGSERCKVLLIDAGADGLSPSDHGDLDVDWCDAGGVCGLGPVPTGQPLWVAPTARKPDLGSPTEQRNDRVNAALRQRTLRWAGQLLAADKLQRGRHEDSSADRTRARLLIEQQRFERAVEVAGKATTRNPLDSEAWALQAEALRKSNQPVLALIASLNASHPSPGDGDLRVGVALAYLEVGDATTALGILDEAAKLGAESARVSNARGMAYAAAGDHDRALDAFGRAIETDPTLGSACLNRAEVLASRGDYAAAARDAAQAIEADLLNGQAYRRLAWYLLRTGQADAAWDHYRTAVRIDERGRVASRQLERPDLRLAARNANQRIPASSVSSQTATASDF